MTASVARISQGTLSSFAERLFWGLGQAEKSRCPTPIYMGQWDTLEIAGQPVGHLWDSTARNPWQTGKTAVPFCGTRGTVMGQKPKRGVPLG